MKRRLASDLTSSPLSGPSCRLAALFRWLFMAGLVVAIAIPRVSSADEPAGSEPPSASQEKEKASEQKSSRDEKPPRENSTQHEKQEKEEKESASEQDESSSKDPAAKVARTDAAKDDATGQLAKLLAEAREKEHPLLPALEFAVTALRHIEKDIRDYTCLLIKRERIHGKLTDYHYIQAKIRHRREKDGEVVVPFSVYLKFLKPARYRGREVLYVEGRYNNDLIAKRGGRRNPNLTLRLEPTGPLAMDGNRYPITEIGFYNLAKRLIEVVGEELEHDDATVEIFDNAKINGRPCRRFKVTHPEKKEGLRFHIAEVYVDLEYEIPVYYAAYLWPSKPDGKPRLIEQYIYTQVKINVGLTDEDFDIHNPEYGFRDIDTVPVAKADPKRPETSEAQTKKSQDEPTANGTQEASAEAEETKADEQENNDGSSTKKKAQTDNGLSDAKGSSSERERETK